LFFNGNNPLNLRSAYGSSDFDRTHVFNFSYMYQLPKFKSAASLAGKFTSGWAPQGSPWSRADSLTASSTTLER